MAATAAMTGTAIVTPVKAMVSSPVTSLAATASACGPSG